MLKLYFLIFLSLVFGFTSYCLLLIKNIVLTESVHRHMQQYEVEYLQFAFRWMNNLLMRELPLRCTIRLWDTYQVHRRTHARARTHVYVHTHRARTPRLIKRKKLRCSATSSCCDLKKKRETL